MKDNNVKRNTEKNESTPKKPNMNGYGGPKTKPHRQTQGNKPKAAEKDMTDQKQGYKEGSPDPFELMMQMASRNSRYSMPFETNGTADPGDPSNITPDENENMPKKRSWS